MAATCGVQWVAGLNSAVRLDGLTSGDLECYRLRRRRTAAIAGRISASAAPEAGSRPV
jgi:hypothetical protein